MNMIHMLGILAIVFLSAPFVVYAVSLDIDHNRVELKDSKVEEIRELAKNTWMYFNARFTICLHLI